MSADGSSVSIKYRAETEFGVTPTGSPKYDLLRFVSETFRQQTGTTTSAEVRDDRQVSDIVRTSLDTAGELNFELSYGTYDDWFEAALLSADWTTEQSTVAADDGVSFDEGTGVIALAVGSWANTPSVGSWIKVSGSTSNNGVYKVSAATSNSITISNGVLVDEAAGQDVTIVRGSEITTGTTFRSFDIERDYTDLSNQLAGFTGQTIDTLSLNVTADAILTGSFGLLGKTEVSRTATNGDGTPTARTVTGVMNAIDNVVGVFNDGSRFDVTSFGMNLANNLRSRLQVSTLGAVSIGKGTVNVTGTVQSFYEDAVIYNKYLAFTDTSIAFVFTKDNDSYVFDFPSVKLTTGQRPSQGINTDVINDLGFTCRRSPTEGVTFRIVRFPSA